MKKIIILLLLLAGCTDIDLFMCPEDKCKQNVIETLQGAESSIHFMVYSFTDDDISDALIDKFNQGVNVKGVMEKQQRSRYSEFSKLKDSGIDVKWDKNRASMHHKVFIIDEKIVITGSYNPTKNGNEKNNENLLIIHDKSLAELYIKEFNSLY